jgi:dihydrofolate reductase
MRLTIQTFLSLDGVMQAPGGPEEDPSDSFTHGGWSFPFDDEDFGAAVTGYLERASALLLGRRTYEIFSSYWPRQTDPANPVASRLNGLPKHVASRTLTEVTWAGSALISGDLVDAVTRLKEQPGDELQVHGSGALAQTLIEADLIDEYRLYFFPVHLGSGRKLFTDGARAASLRLLSSSQTSRGVVIASYAPAGPVEYGSF